jgi:hemerythrin-like metal-binding protein
MSGLTVSRRIYGGFGVIILLLLVLAGLGIATIGTIHTSFTKYDHISDNAQRVLRIRGSFAEMRRNVVIFAEKADADSLKRIRAMQSALKVDLPKAAEATIDPGRKTNLEKMVTLFKSYSDDLDQVERTRTTKEELIDKRMNVIGVQARKNLTQVVHSAMNDGDYEAAALAGVAEEALMLTRINALKFIAEPSDALAKEAEANAALFVEEAEALTKRLHNPERKRLAAEAEGLAKDYRAAFTQVVGASKALNQLVYIQMRGIGADFTDLSEKTVESQDQAMDAIRDATYGTMDSSRAITWTGALVALGLAAAFSFLIARSIVVPLAGMTNAMTELSKGNKRVEIPARDRHDEIGAMAEAMEIFKENTLRMDKMQAEQEEAKHRAEADRKKAMNKMADNFEESVGKVIETVTSAATELQAASGQMAGTATETSAQATAVSSASQEASANVQTVASATEELAASIREIAHQVELSQNVSVRAGDEANRTTSEVRALSDKVGKIGEIVNLINDIASQTNLLALNATIEAARAGDAGKGFAVVANEVKSLANQTARATSEIASQIQAVQDGTGAAVRAIDSISQVISEMAEISAAVAAAVQEQNAATGEIARNVDQAAEGTQEVSRNVVSVEQAARETGAAAEQIRSSATDLSRQAEYLRNEVGRFLTEVRADSKDMKLMAWDSGLEIGVASIDRHHRQLVDGVNDLYRKMMQGAVGDAAVALLSSLEGSMKAHFDEEEALMSRHHYDGLAAHRQAHQSFLQGLPAVKAAIQSNAPDANSKVFDFVAHWMTRHIKSEDMALATFLRAKKVA